MTVESGETSFVETIESIETHVHYLELSFVPPDLRPLAPPPEPGPTVMARDLVAMSYAVHVLPAGTDWEEALARARDWIAEAGTQRKLDVDPIPTFELSRLAPERWRSSQAFRSARVAIKGPAT